jgi:hypothetical protein
MTHDHARSSPHRKTMALGLSLLPFVCLFCAAVGFFSSSCSSIAGGLGYCLSIPIILLYWGWPVVIPLGLVMGGALAIAAYGVAFGVARWLSSVTLGSFAMVWMGLVMGSGTLGYLYALVTHASSSCQFDL